MGSRAGVDGQPGGFVHRDYGRVLIKNFYGQILRLGFERRRLGWRDLDFFSAAQHQRRLRGRAVHQHASVVDPALDSRTAVLGEVILKKTVEARGGAGGEADGQRRVRRGTPPHSFIVVHLLCKFESLFRRAPSDSGRTENKSRARSSASRRSGSRSAAAIPPSAARSRRWTTPESGEPAGRERAGGAPAACAAARSRSPRR